MPKSLLRELSAAAIVAALADCAERWSDADFPPRVRAAQAVEARLGYNAAVVDYALDRLFFSIRRDALEAAIGDELGSLDALDGPVGRRDGSRAFARGVDRTLIVSSDTTIGVAIAPAVYALCAKCEVVVKDRSDLLVEAFFETLARERPEFASAATARAWSGGNDAQERQLLRLADVVVAFGSDDALTAIRGGLRADARFVGFGHRIGIGYVDAAAPLTANRRADLLAAIATDALLYDGSGCMSLQALFVAGGDATVRAFVDDLAGAFDRVSIEFPAGRVGAERAAAAAAYRKLGAFRAANGQGVTYAPALASATIVFDPPHDQPPPLLPRVLPVFSVADGAGVIAYLGRHRVPVSVVGVVETSSPNAVALAAAVGAVRVTRLGQMQAPPLSGHHGGAARIADFVRWIDCE